MKSNHLCALTSLWQSANTVGSSVAANTPSVPSLYACHQTNTPSFSGARYLPISTPEVFDQSPPEALYKLAPWGKPQISTSIAFDQSQVCALTLFLPHCLTLFYRREHEARCHNIAISTNTISHLLCKEYFPLISYLKPS